MSVRIKNRNASPINGWQFVDAPINAQPLTSWGFDDMVQQVIARRAANPRFKLSTDLKTVQNEVDLQNALRMVAIPNSEGFLIYDGAASSNPPRASLSRKWANAVGGATKIASGANLVIDWLGSGGKPVESSIAIKRAEICAVCPQNSMNVEGREKSWTERFTEPAAEFIKRQLSVKGDMALSTPSDDKLGVCNACSCILTLKAWCPIEHIEVHMSQDVKAKLDNSCWILKEKESHGS